jgi:hypothetical protein
MTSGTAARTSRPRDRGCAAQRLAALSLLADAANKQPLMCVIDDAQWLDRASAQATGFVTRRLLAERVPERFIAEAGGNPLALLKLPQGLTPAELAGAFGVTAAPGLPRRLEDSFRQRLGGLPLDELQRARAALPHGQIAFASFRGRDAETLLLQAARLFEPLDARLARETYLDALAITAQRRNWLRSCPAGAARYFRHQSR